MAAGAELKTIRVIALGGKTAKIKRIARSRYKGKNVTLKRTQRKGTPEKKSNTIMFIK